MLDTARTLAIGTACALALTPLAYCEIQAQENRSKEKIACAEAGGDWRFQSCRFVK